MADTSIDSVHAETILNGNYQDSEERKPGLVKGKVKGSNAMKEENGNDGRDMEEPNEKESHGEEDNVEADDTKQEEAEAVKSSQEVIEKKAKGRGRGRAKKTTLEATQGNEKPEKKESQAKKRVKMEFGTPIIERPARERKSIDRFIASTEKEKVRELKIEKGAGTPLKDIPNVVFLLSKRKGSDESVQLLHKLLYGKRVKPFHAKLNIFQFSGFVWDPNQEKEKAKAKERFEKCHKESLFQVSELLDLSFLKSEKKEDIVTKLLEFLVSPHKTRDELAEDNQKLKGKKSKGKKRKRRSQKGSGKESSVETPRKRRKGESTPKVEEAAEESMEMEDVDDKGDEWAGDEEDEPEEEEPVKRKRGRKGASDDDDIHVKPTKSKKGRKPAKKNVKKNEKIDSEEALGEAEESEEEKSKSPKKVPLKSPAKSGKAAVQSPPKRATKSEAASSKVFSRKKKKEDDQEVVKEIVKETPSKEKQRKPRAASKASAKDKEKTGQNTKGNDPSDEELRTAICNLLKEADFSTVTFTDVVKQLEKQFKVDLTQKKGHVKVLIREEINKIAEEDEGEDDADEEAGRDKEESDSGALADQAIED